MSFLSWLRNCTRSATSQGVVRPNPRANGPYRPRFEALEDRCLPSGFAPSASYSLGTNAQAAVVTADVNHDGALDLVTAGYGTWNSLSGTYVGGGVSVLLGQTRSGQPTGTFGSAHFSPVGPSYSVAVGDINGDGNPDIVTGSGSVLLGNGKGAFDVGTTYVGGLNNYVALADVNGDGKLDVITSTLRGSVNGYVNTINVLLGNGNGTFQTPVTTTAPVAWWGMTVGNFDGNLDVVVGDTTNNLYLLPGNGNGSFGAPQFITSAAPSSSALGLYALTAADLNHDGKLDVAFASKIGTGGHNVTVGVLLGNGHGAFTQGKNYTLGGVYQPYLSSSIGLAAADVNGDGKLDLISVGGVVGGTSVGPLVSVLLGKGDGTFSGEVDHLTARSVTNAACFAMGDFNGDGTADVAVAGGHYSGDGLGGDMGDYVDVLLWSNKKK